MHEIDLFIKLEALGKMVFCFTSSRIAIKHVQHRCLSSNVSSKPKNVAMFGLGLYAQRIYYPLMYEYGRKLNLNLKLVVDLESAKHSIEHYLKKQYAEFRPKQIVYLSDKDNNPGSSRLNNAAYDYLSTLVKEHEIDCAIITTEPLAHKVYANFSLDHNLSILMDKPITTRENIISDVNEAKGLYEDYLEIKKSYTEAKKRNPDLGFVIQTERRFHPAYLKMQEVVEEVSEKCNIPITSIHSYHSDGEWRKPFEIANQHYHSYYQGYGKISHSGYHSLDMLLYLTDASFKKCRNKTFNNMQVSTTMVCPPDLMNQVTTDDFKSLYGAEEYNKIDPYLGKEDQLNAVLEKCGEVDSFIKLLFKKDEKIMSVGTLNLHHNGFSSRAWLSNENRNLYKGNGRMKHESYIIQQGPFQSVHLHSYKGDGKEHLDVAVYRNPHAVTKNFGEYSKFSSDDFNQKGHEKSSQNVGFFQLLNSLHGLKEKNKSINSEFLSHELTMKVMSSTYESHCRNKTVTINEL